MDLLGLRAIADKLVIFGNLRRDTIFKHLIDATTERGFSKFLLLLIQQSEKHGLSGNIFKRYIVRFLFTDENIFSLACERGEVNEKLSLYKLVENDIKLVVDLLNYDLSEMAAYEQIVPYIPNVTSQDMYTDMDISNIEPQKFLQMLIDSYKTKGCGVLCGNSMFTFASGKLIPAKKPDKVDFNDIIGCERQKRLICDNIEAFVGDGVASNMLLTGPKGTGKSSCVKALISEYGNHGLCIVSISREQYTELPMLLNVLSERGKKFIVMLDDLSFDLSLEAAEIGYKQLKTILEGGVESTPRNVLFCATSNRRALVTENWADKHGTVIEDGEVHATDAVNEKQSLKDRFGLVVSFAKPTPPEFFEITKQLLAKHGINLPDEMIKRRANEWELGQNGLSGRAAKNLTDAIIRELKG